MKKTKTKVAMKAAADATISFVYERDEEGYEVAVGLNSCRPVTGRRMRYLWNQLMRAGIDPLFLERPIFRNDRKYFLIYGPQSSTGCTSYVSVCRV